MVCNCPHHPHHTRIAIARECATHEEQLVAFIEHDDIKGVRRKLAAGARVNGCRKEGYHPIITAVREGNLVIAKLLLKEGANPDSAVPKDVLNSQGEVVYAAGTRPLHIAIMRRFDLGLFQVLVQAGAALDTPDSHGATPLMMAAMRSTRESEKDRQVQVVLVRELIEAGADLAPRDKNGLSAVHFAASLADPEPLKMLVWKMPEAMNFLTDSGKSPLYMASWHGRAKTVSLLLAMGANQPEMHFRSCNCGCCNTEYPLRAAACKGHVDVLRVLIDAVESVGGLEATIPSAIQVTCTSASNAYSTLGGNPERWVKILQMLLDVEGEERQGHWARSQFLHSPVLHHAAVSGSLATVSLLLVAGADEMALNLMGHTASEVMCEPHEARIKGSAEIAATRRMLARGPAFRARSWVWPAFADVEENEGADSSVADLDASPSSSAAQNSSLGVRIWRSTSRKRFVRLIGRHALKGVAAAKGELVVRRKTVDELLG